LRALWTALEQNEDARAALKHLVKQLQDARQTNTNLNRKNFGLTQTAAKHERNADTLTRLNAQLEVQKNELLQELQNLLGQLTTYKNSEILNGLKQIRTFVGSLIR
jgi:predicted HAD superfamily phosphohydrolase